MQPESPTLPSGNRFNEAAAIKPRKSSRRPSGRGRPDASMRPRQLSRGNLHIRSRGWLARCASMRPRQLSRGNAAATDRSISASLASMRPRQLSRGNFRGRDLRRNDRPASMRPRQLSRGNDRLFACFPPDRQSFNEAAAIKPRKWRNRCTSRRPERCFNEAAAIKPRKCSAGERLCGVLPGLQ